jgi:hypothetical protein
MNAGARPFLPLLLAIAGCAASAGPAATPHAKNAQLSANSLRFARDERQLFAQLASLDARLALRTGVPASETEVHKSVVGAILAEDSTASVGDEGIIDVFSFDARQRGLDEAAKKVGAWTYALEPELELERRLLVRLVDEEKARVAEEKALPRSASELVRGIVKAWVAPSADGRRTRDTWLARRLGDVQATLKDGSLTKFEANELDDSLDSLERLTADLAQSAGAIARLRVALDQFKPARDPIHDGETVKRVVRAHLGISVDSATFDVLERTERELRQKIALANKARSESEVRAIEELAMSRVLVEGRCVGTYSHVRAIEPPPERAYVCGVLRTVADAADERSRAAALVALHTHLVIALWTSPIHFGDDAPYRAANKLRPTMPVPPEREVHLLQVAAVRPVAALAAGWATVLLLQRGVDYAASRAKVWLAFGDAPFDIVESARALEINFASEQSDARLARHEDVAELPLPRHSGRP